MRLKQRLLLAVELKQAVDARGMLVLGGYIDYEGLGKQGIRGTSTLSPVHLPN